MLILRLEDFTFVDSSHDSMDTVCVKRIFRHDTLSTMEKGSLPFINYAELSPGKSFSPHHHGDEEIPSDESIGMSEFFFILEGEGIFTGGEEKADVGKYDLIYIPRGEIHSLKNTDPENKLKYLCWGVSTGGGTFLV